MIIIKLTTLPLLSTGILLAVIGMAQMLTILVVGINLSIGSVMAFSAMLCGPLLWKAAHILLIGTVGDDWYKCPYWPVKRVLNTKLKTLLLSPPLALCSFSAAWHGLLQHTVQPRIQTDTFSAMGDFINQEFINMSIVYVL